MKRALFLLAALCVLQVSEAQTVYITEDFNYNSGNLVGQGSWSQISTVSTNPIQVVDSTAMVTSTPLRYPGYSMLGGKAIAANTSGQNIYKNFGSVANSGSVYASFLLRVTAAQTGGNAFMALSSVPNTNNWLYSQVYAKSSGTGYVLGAVKYRQAQPLYSTTVLAFNTTYLVVAKYTINPGALNNDSVSLYAFSSGVPATEAAATPMIPPVGYASPLSDADSLTSLSIRQANATSSPNVQMDAFRVSSTWMGGAPLPASLLSFNAIARGNANHLSWVTGNEHDVAFFEAERSFDGNNFEPVQQLAAYNRSGGASYTASDYVVASGDVYYRLKTVNVNGSTEYSSTVLVRRRSAAPMAVTAYPNPTFGGVIVTHTAAGNAAIRVFDAVGRLAMFALSTPGSLQTPLDLSALLPGWYQAVYQDGDDVQSVAIQKN